jgi:hypothetical protein
MDGVAGTGPRILCVVLCTPQVGLSTFRLRMGSCLSIGALDGGMGIGEGPATEGSRAMFVLARKVARDSLLDPVLCPGWSRSISLGGIVSEGEVVRPIARPAIAAPST